MSPGSLWDSLARGKRLIAVAGAGGKKSTMYALAAAHPGRVAVTTTVNCPYPQQESESGVFTLCTEEHELPERVRRVIATHPRLFLARPGKRDDLAAGLSGTTISRLRAAHLFDAMLVKADGARRRLLKAPADDEPVYPADADLILYVVSAHALGRPLAAGIVHRVERFTAVTGATEGTPIDPGHISALLMSPAGALKDVAPNIAFIPVINRVDTAERDQAAREIAARVLAGTQRIDQVAIGCLGDASPRVELVGRDR